MKSFTRKFSKQRSPTRDKRFKPFTTNRCTIWSRQRRNPNRFGCWSQKSKPPTRTSGGVPRTKRFHCGNNVASCSQRLRRKRVQRPARFVRTTNFWPKCGCTSGWLVIANDARKSSAFSPKPRPSRASSSRTTGRPSTKNSGRNGKCKFKLFVLSLFYFLLRSKERPK
uniref:(northern house mosquito) hypothetical protein n=1 Tax=Culex pipiens TaxID=7175 RepID=A0A8D8K8L9_CULPI